LVDLYEEWFFAALCDWVVIGLCMFVRCTGKEDADNECGRYSANPQHLLEDGDLAKQFLGHFRIALYVEI
jgi:hypothetical protein